jgi:hypothetical protein
VRCRGTSCQQGREPCTDDCQEECADKVLSGFLVAVTLTVVAFLAAVVIALWLP